MAARKHLKAVGGTGEAVVVMSVSDAAESGSRIAELRAMRRVIARRIDDEATQARDLAALSKRQMDISKEIQELMTEAEGDELGKAADSPDAGFDPTTV